MQMNQALSAELNYVFLEKWSPLTQGRPTVELPYEKAQTPVDI